MTPPWLVTDSLILAVGAEAIVWLMLEDLVQDEVAEEKVETTELRRVEVFPITVVTVVIGLKVAVHDELPDSAVESDSEDVEV